MYRSVEIGKFDTTKGQVNVPYMLVPENTQCTKNFNIAF